jgi:hypothetical protein
VALACLSGKQTHKSSVAALATGHLYAVVIFHTRGDSMFGNKQDKQKRLKHMTEIIDRNPGIKAAQVARKMSSHRSTVMRDLASLEKRGVLLTEDQRGGLSLFRRLFGR